MALLKTGGFSVMSTIPASISSSIKISQPHCLGDLLDYIGGNHTVVFLNVDQISCSSVDEMPQQLLPVGLKCGRRRQP